MMIGAPVSVGAGGSARRGVILSHYANDFAASKSSMNLMYCLLIYTIISICLRL